MKRMFSFILALCLCLSCACFAEDAADESVYAIPAYEQVEMDLNGDGVAETIDWYILENSENYAEAVFLSIASEDRPTCHMEVWLYMASVYAADVDGDGIVEIFITGDEMSDDYYTMCLHYAQEGLIPLLFEDASRGSTNEGYYDAGYGLLTSISDGTVILNGSQDVLGTRFGTRAYGLQDGKFELVDDGLWRFDYSYFDDSMLWASAAITPKIDIPAMFMADGDEYEGAIKAGEKILITASDKVSVVYFRLQDGRQGYFHVEPDIELGYGHYINGVYETEVFGFLPYAD